MDILLSPEASINRARLEAADRETLLSTAVEIFDRQARDKFFTSFVQYRKAQILQSHPELAQSNLATIFKVINYKQLAPPESLNIPSVIFLLESLALKYYPHWLAFWCACEIHEIKKAHNPSVETLRREHDLIYEDTAYSGILFEDISRSNLLVYTLHHDAPMRLKDAVALINLELFVIGEQWYEILLLLKLSQQGKHFILLSNTEQGESPLMVASVLVQDWHRRSIWLSYHPQFQSEKWQFCLPEHAYEEFNRHKLFDMDIKQRSYSTLQFDSKFSMNLARTNAVCELLRFTVSGTRQQKLYFLYLGQKKLMTTLHEAGYRIGFTIIGKPCMHNFNRSIDKKAYFHSSCCDINSDGLIVYRGFWNFDYMIDAFKTISFLDYSSAIDTASTIARRGMVLC